MSFTDWYTGMPPRPITIPIPLPPEIHEWVSSQSKELNKSPQAVVIEILRKMVVQSNNGG